MTIKDALAKAKRSISPQIDKALNEDVAEAVKRRESHVINEVVYDALTPASYQRRGGMFGRYAGGEGLGDIVNMEHKVIGGVLSVTNETPPNTYLNGRNPSDGMTTTAKPIARLVEDGIYNPDGYGYDYTYVKPRPFTKETIKSLNKDKMHVRALKSGLIRKINGTKIKVK